VVDPSFANYRLGLSSIQRVWTGGRWLEGPAWSSQGNYLVFSDVHTDTEYRLIWDDMRVTPFRKPSFNTNGHAIDSQGRLISCQHLLRRIVRWEHDGTMSVLADNYQGKRLNSPNDATTHLDGSVWFSDPPYGDRLSEGQADALGGLANPGNINPKIGNQVGGDFKRELPNNVYRWDPNGTLSVITTPDQVADPNGVDFSPDYKTFYAIDTGAGPGDQAGGPGQLYAFDVSSDGKSVSNKRIFSDMVIDGVKCSPDGTAIDVDGNVWVSSGPPLGYAGVLVFNPQGMLIGRIRLPERAANLAFGGPKHNMLFITATQSLYVLQVNTQGAHPQ
jgi:gluconolactonase